MSGTCFSTILGRNFWGIEARDTRISTPATLVLLIACLGPVRGTDANSPRKFLATYCYGCHGKENQEAERRFDRLTQRPGDTSELELWQEALDQINRGSMPPEDADQPSAAERVKAAAEITEMLRQAAAKLDHAGNKTVLRRLNRYEYDRSVRWLLGLEEMLADPTASFPPDGVHDNFDNVGSSLVLSDFLLANYLKAARVYLDEAVAPERQPAPQTWKFTAPFCPTGNRHDGKDRPGRYQHVRKNYHDAGGYLWIRQFREGVPHRGRYRIRIRAEAIGRDYPYPESIIKVPKADPIRMEVFATSSRFGDLDTNNPSDRRIGEFELVDNEPRWYELDVWLDKGYQPRIAYPNGPLSVKAARSRLVQRYPAAFQGYIDGHVPKYNSMHPEYDPDTKDELIAEFFTEQRRLAAEGKPTLQFGISHRVNTRSAWSQFYQEYDGPRIRVFEIRLEGPFYDHWPPNSHTLLMGPADEETPVAELFANFAARAFRRPVTTELLDSMTSLYANQLADGRSTEEAMLTVYQSILCSPHFLYLHRGEGPLDEFDRASRLSYFLWSAPPDSALTSAAAAGKLTDRAMLRNQVDRLLDSDRAMTLVERFTDAWLELSKLGTMLPSQREHPEYFVENLEEAMRQETYLFMRDMIEKDRPLDDFLTSDETFVNGPLARLYGVSGIAGSEFRQVKLNSVHRGGLLGMASVLTATANGIETSPVVRGVWLLENILGTPPPAPPPDVEPIEPDIRGTTTIREQLSKHREVATCRTCHARIDPLGFALESFDEIGRFRRSYKHRRRRNLPIDTTGKLPSGEKFSGDFRTTRVAGKTRRVDLYQPNSEATHLRHRPRTNGVRPSRSPTNRDRLAGRQRRVSRADSPCRPKQRVCPLAAAETGKKIKGKNIVVSGPSSCL